MSASGLITIMPALEESMKFLPPPSPEHSHDSILIYVAAPDSMVPMRVMDSDSIESVKLRIQSCKGIVTRNQKLVCGGRVLSRSDSLVRDYGVSNGSIVHVVIRLSSLLLIHVKTCCGKEFSFRVGRSQDIASVKRQIARGKLDLSEDHEILLDGKPVEDQRLVDDLSKNCRDAVIHLFVRKSAKIRASPVGKNYELSITSRHTTKESDVERHDVDSSEFDFYFPILKKLPSRETLLEPIIVNSKISMPEGITNLIKTTLRGLENGNDPVRSSEGTGGAYFMMDASGTKYLSVFKPTDEEPMAVNNPRGLPMSEDGEGLKKGTRVGEGGIRECAVYLLDHPKSGLRLGSYSFDIRGFAGVPPTVYVKCLHKGFNHQGAGVKVKTGSLQSFVESHGSCEDIGPGAFPVQEVHKIAVLDIRMANADRHAGNILWSKGEDGRITLIPIDHGYCLPYTFEDCTFEWLYWPQSREAFSADTLEYIKSLDAEKDVELLKLYGWEVPAECALVLRISTMLLKKGAGRGMTAYGIGKLMCRENPRKASVLEEIVEEAAEAASLLPGSSEAAFLQCVSNGIDQRL
ncbi:hypothetical protein M569_08384, partial [Genlisea aurea]